MTASNGCFGRLLRIDLSRRSFLYEDLPADLTGEVLGGKGLGSRLLTRENPPGVDPLGPENRFILTVGPATGTGFWSHARAAAFAKSPATGGFAESYCGGTLAPKIKGCGVDAVVLEGKASGLTVLHVDETGVVFEEASRLKGMETHLAERQILGSAAAGASALCIGPAGENLVRFACIKSDRWRSFGRCGLGAVLGSKNVKGISFCGRKTAEVADPTLLRVLIRDVARKAAESPVTALYRRLGTPLQVAATNARKCFPTGYWTSGYFPKWETLSADYMLKEFDVKPTGCPNCFLKCTKHSRILRGRHAGLEIEGPEYETIYALGGLNEIEGLEEVAWLNDLCDRLGLDTMSAGNITAFAAEARRRGRIDFEIGPNNPDAVAELLTLTAERRGVGDLFARGIREAATELGLEDVAVHVKGLEPAGFEPRVLKGMGLSYATSARGACHLRGTFYKAELYGEADAGVIPGKARAVIDYEDRAALFDCLILCRFFRDFILWDELGHLIEVLTGRAYSKAGLEVLANAVTQETRRFNLREGLGEDLDTLPPRLLNEKTVEGAALPAEELGRMLAEYNALRSARESGKRQTIETSS
ncbi:MAG: aldehyde ferredoxin oxidoreductase family protein [Acidobacteriota bacterium]|nr:aldehyde ferredoxin oxidoreductase family protein [Acidobacteriota bacterium]